jgi:hypothetical protein
MERAAVRLGTYAATGRGAHGVDLDEVMNCVRERVAEV